jgi:serine/threonine protein kinase
MNPLPVIPGYRIIKKLGTGGMATVYLGVQEKLNRNVAIKILSPLLLHDERFIQRFFKEAELSSRLNHQNIITIHDVDRHDDYIYIVSEYLEGGSLRDCIITKQLSPESCLEVVKQIADALGYAHGRDVIHRDIKPENIMFRKNGVPVILDFGIAKAVGSMTKLTKTGMSIGTPHYMSPEQGRGKTLDHRSDIYSLGVVFYEMLTGKVPYDADDSITVAIMHIQEPVPRLPKWKQKFQGLIDIMMAKDPKKRPQSAKELLRILNTFTQKEGMADAGVAMLKAEPLSLKNAGTRFLEFLQKILDRSHLRVKYLVAILVILLTILIIILITESTGDSAYISSKNKNLVSSITSNSKTDSLPVPLQPETELQTARPTPASEYRQYLNRARELLSNRRFQEALENVRQAKKISNTSEVSSLETDILRQLGKMENKRFNQLLVTARRYVKNSQFKKAKKVLQEARKIKITQELLRIEKEVNFKGRNQAQPALNVKKYTLTKVRFFESGYKLPRKRYYKTRFKRMDTRYINTQIWFTNKYYRIKDSKLNIIFKYYDSENNLVCTINRSVKVMKGNANQTWAIGYGHKAGGYYWPGKYTVKIYFNKKYVGQYFFTVLW